MEPGAVISAIAREAGVHPGGFTVSWRGPCTFCPLVALGAEPKRQALRFTFGTNARNRRGLSFMICRSTSSLAPAFFSLGTKRVRFYPEEC